MLVTLDANWLMRKCYHRQEKDGKYQDAPKDFIERVAAVIGKLKPHDFVACWDCQHELNFRKEIDPEYKSGRTARPEGLTWAITEARIYMDMHGICSLEMPPYEADDLIASYTAQYNGQVVIYGTDKDFDQLLEAGRVTKLREFDPDARIDQSCWLPYQKWVESLGCHPDDAPDPIEFQCLVGDSTDDIKGAHLVGPKKALAYLQHYKTIDNLLQDIDSITIQGKPITEKQKESLTEFKPRYPTVRKLIALKTDIPVSMNIACPQELPIRW